METSPAFTHVVRVPGRVNLIGEHTDYQGGLCLPIAIERRTRVHFSASATDATTLRSEQFPGDARVEPHTNLDTYDGPAWGRAIIAVTIALTERGHRFAPITGAIDSTVPLGSGLSSSAALNVALALAMTNAAGAPITGTELALVAQRAEHVSGVPCGIMDQMACVHGRANHALLLDCSDLSVLPIAMPAGVAVIVVHSGLPRALADSAYAERRAAVEDAAARLGVPTLRTAALNHVVDDPYAHHVVSENLRVTQFVEAAGAGDTSRMGMLLDESHASLADDFMVSTPELDVLTDLLRSEGAFGARLTGAGFGGCVIALSDQRAAEGIAQRAAERYRSHTNLQPTPFVTTATDGAMVTETSR